MTEHPITPPPELVAMWAGFSARHHSEGSVDYVLDLATKAAQWGADQELEACCALLELSDSNVRDFLQSARRPKTPSLKKRALKGLDIMIANGHLDAELTAAIREILEASHD